MARSAGSCSWGSWALQTGYSGLHHSELRFHGFFLVVTLRYAFCFDSSFMIEAPSTLWGRNLPCYDIRENWDTSCTYF